MTNGILSKLRGQYAEGREAFKLLTELKVSCQELGWHILDGFSTGVTSSVEVKRWKSLFSLHLTKNKALRQEISFQNRKGLAERRLTL